MSVSGNTEIRATHRHDPECGCLDRRGMFASLGALGGLGLIGGGLSGRPAAAQTLTRAQRDAMSPDDVIDLMKRGNERFRAAARKDRDWLAQQRVSAAGQSPMAVLLSCIDSRTPAEILFDLGLGDIFNNRLAGSVVDVAAIGGMEFACQLAGAKLVLVLGHTSCGAVAGAVAGAKLGNLTALLAKIEPSISVTQFTGERSASNMEFVDAVSRTHVGRTIASIREASPVLVSLEKDRKIKIAGAMYDLSTGAVEFMN